MTLFDEDFNPDGPPGTPAPTTPSSATARPPIIPDIPTMGIIYETSKGWVAVTGGKPNVHWTGLEKSARINSDYKTEPLRFRGQDNATATKTFLEREVAITNTLRPGDDIHLFAKDFSIKMVQHGMDTIAYVPDPFDDTKMSYVLEDYPKFQADKNIRDQVELVSSRYDSYDRANSKNATKCLLNSLDETLRQRVVSRLRDTDIHFPIVWMKVVAEFITYTPLRWESIRNRIKGRHPKQFPGEDIGLLCDAYDKDAKELTVAGQYDHHLTRNMLEAFLKCSSGDDSFRHELRCQLVDLKKALDHCHFMDIAGKNSYLSGLYMGYLDITELARRLYLDAKANNNWSGPGAVFDSKVPQANKASAYNAGLRSTFGNRSSNNSNHQRDRSQDKCAICGKLGHWARDCSQNKNGKPRANNAKDNHQKGQASKGSKNWKYQPPAPGANSTVRHQGTNFQWCSKCRRWTSSHNTETHGQSVQGAAIPTPQTTVRASVMREYEDPSCDPSAWHLTVNKIPKFVSQIPKKDDNFFSKFIWPLSGLIFGMLMLPNLGVTNVWSAVTPIIWLIVLLVLKQVIYDFSLPSRPRSKFITKNSLNPDAQEFHPNFLIPNNIPHICDDVFRKNMMDELDNLSRNHLINQPIRVLNKIDHPRPVKCLVSTKRTGHWARDCHKNKSCKPKVNNAQFSRNKGQVFNGSKNCKSQPQGTNFQWCSKCDSFGKTGKNNKSGSQNQLGKTKKNSVSPPSNWVNTISRSRFKARLDPRKSINNDHPFTVNDISLSDLQRILTVVEWDEDHPNLISRAPEAAKKAGLKKTKSCAADVSTCFWDHHNDDPPSPPSTSTTLEVSSTKDDPNDSPSHYVDRHSPQDVHNSLKLCDSSSCNGIEPLIKEMTISRPSSWISMIQLETLTEWPEGLSSYLSKKRKAPLPLRKHVIPETEEFPVIWDSGASHTITFDKQDFNGDLTPCNRTLRGIGNDDFKIRGFGTVNWCHVDINGRLRNIQVPSYYVPEADVRLLSTSHLLQNYPGEHITLHNDHLMLSGFSSDIDRGPIKVPINPDDNIPTSMVLKKGMKLTNVRAFLSVTSEVAEENINLSPPEKELLKWHYKLGHIGFNKVKFLMNSGGLATNESCKKVHSRINKVLQNPKCAACIYGKQVRRTAPGHIFTMDHERIDTLKRDDLLPGQTVSVDHFITRTPGRLIAGNGKQKDSGDMYSGGCIFVDHSSGFIHVELQCHLNSHETLNAKIAFESFCLSHGVVPTKYLTDNGSAFTGAEFQEHLKEFLQHSIRSAPGAHHHNGVAERSIRTIMTIARTMLIHRSIHWPNVSTNTLWPLAVLHAVHLVNHVPNPNLGHSPFELFSKTKYDHGDLNHIHVWGCPVYVLSPSLLNGVKTPRWQPRSERFAYVGLSGTHSKTSPLVLNLSTGRITTKWSVVFDDWFATVTSNPSDFPDFQSDEWHDLFGDYYIDPEYDSDEIEDIIDAPPTSLQIDHRTRVAERMQPQIRPTITSNAIDLNSADIAPGGLELKDPPNSMTKTQSSSTITSSSDSPVTPSSRMKMPNFSLLNDDFNDPVIENISSPSTPIQSQPSTPMRNSPINIDTTSHRPRVSFDLIDEEVKQVRPSSLRRSTRNAPIRELLQYDIKGGPKEYWRKDYNYYSSIAPSDDDDDSTLSQPRCWLASMVKKDPDLLTYDEAMKSEFVDKWIEAMKAELSQIEGAETWTQVPISSATGKIIPGTWVLRIKRSPDGDIKKFKARFCVRGDLQDGVHETYAPVVQWSSVRIFLVLTFHLQWVTCSIDFVNAFVQAHLEEPVWIRPPRGFQTEPGMCLKLNKSLYGLTVAPRLWYQHLFRGLLKAGFTQSKHDPCMLYKTNMLIVVYVDDLGVAAPTSELIDELVEDLKSQGFSLTREGSFSEFLGIKFNRLDNGDIECTQKGLIKKILTLAKMTDCHANFLPTATVPLGKHPDDAPFDEDWSYRSVVGMLLYLSTNTRPDITFAVNQVARFSHNPRKIHGTAVKTILRYLKGTCNRGTIISPTKLLSLDCYVDADFAGLFKADPMIDSSSSKSRTGYVILLGGTPLVWKSKLQTRTSLSTLEAEYTALSSSLRQMLPIRSLLIELAGAIPTLPKDFKATFDCRVFEDNKGAFLLATNHQLSSRTKYFHVDLHHFWENMNDGDVKLFQIATTEQLADYFTKPLTRALFEANRKALQGF